MGPGRAGGRKGCRVGCSPDPKSEKYFLNKKVEGCRNWVYSIRQRLNFGFSPLPSPISKPYNLKMSRKHLLLLHWVHPIRSLVNRTSFGFLEKWIVEPCVVRECGIVTIKPCYLERSGFCECCSSWMLSDSHSCRSVLIRFGPLALATSLLFSSRQIYVHKRLSSAVFHQPSRFMSDHSQDTWGAFRNVTQVVPRQ